jgi:ABC-type multidrug transport system permease subunit
MSDAELLLLAESRKKSGAIAALLNLFLPGAGYAYCGRWALGIIAFFFVVAMFVVSLGFAAFGLVLLLVIDGFLCASRYNKQVVENLLKERAELQRSGATA